MYSFSRRAELHLNQRRHCTVWGGIAHDAGKRRCDILTLRLGEEGSVRTAHPSTAFLLASRQHGRHDDDDDNDDKDDSSFDADPDHATASFEPVNTSVSACGGCLTAISSNRTHA